VERLARDGPTLPFPEFAQLASIVAACALGRGDAETALRHHARIVERAEAGAEPRDRVVAWLGMGDSLLRLQDYARARNAIVQGTDLAIDHDLGPLVAQGLVHLGHAYFCERDYAQAVECYAGARDEHDRLGDSLGACRPLTWLAESHRHRREWALAEAVYLDVLARYDAAGASIGDVAAQGRADVYARLAAMCQDAGRASEAAQYQREAQALGVDAAQVSSQPC
jgi:tetratricopeptide (TPR) repeat protein